mgnify:CR=1 FL=1
MDIQKIREDFPILDRTVYGKPLVYFDNAATTQKPRLVIDSIVDEYYSVNANVLRSCMSPPVRLSVGLSMPGVRTKSFLPVVRQRA